MDKLLPKLDLPPIEELPTPEHGGLLVTLKDGKPDVTIVEGFDRPEMQCVLSVSLVTGNIQTAKERPYADELHDKILRRLNLTEERDKEEAQRRAEEEQRKKDEAERKAEEQKRKEEEKRRAEEERLRKQCEAQKKREAERREREAKKASFPNQVSAWIAELKTVLDQRNQRLDVEGEKAYLDMLEKLDKEKADLEEKIRKLRGEKAETQTALDALGFFQFSEKKPLKEKIRELEASIAKLGSLLNEVPQKRAEAEKNKYSIKSEGRERAKARVEKELPLSELTMPNGKKLDLSTLKEDVYKVASRYEMIKQSEILLFCQEYPEDAVKFALYQLLRDGKLICTYDKREAYYSTE